MFEIEKKIKMPERSGSGRTPIYPFGKMNVGDSFLLPAEQRVKILNASQGFALRHKKKFSVLKDGNQYRCWRTK